MEILYPVCCGIDVFREQSADGPVGRLRERNGEGDETEPELYAGTRSWWLRVCDARWRRVRSRRRNEHSGRQ